MSELVEWLPWIAIAAIPGCFNTIAAFRELAEECRLLPFFEPLKLPGVWLWAMVQFLLPGALFWLTATLANRPPIDLQLIVWAIGFGVGFVTILNARTEIGSHTYHIKSIYALFVGLAYDMIADSQTRRAAVFWTDVEEVLSRCADLTSGLDFLENYFASDITLSPQMRENHQARLDQARNQLSGVEQIKLVKSLIKEVRRRDLPYVLNRFQCGGPLLERYFPNQIKQAIAPSTAS